LLKVIQLGYFITITNSENKISNAITTYTHYCQRQHKTFTTEVCKMHVILLKQMVVVQSDKSCYILSALVILAARPLT